MRFLYLFSLIFLAKNVQAQTTKDSLVLANANWKIENLGKGIVWKSIHFQEKQLFEGNQSINILETKLRNRKLKFFIASADSLTKTEKGRGVLLPTSQLARQNDALAAINGGFFDTKNGGSVDFIKVQNHVLDTTRVRNSFHSKAAVIIRKNKLQLIKGSNESHWEDALNQPDVMLLGPMLIYENQVEKLSKTAFNDNRHPRTCACITNDKKLLLITVDGRTAQAYGMTLTELTFLAKQFDCKTAINFDGGGSTTMYIKDKPFDGVVNYPCDNKVFDHLGERKVSNILMILAKD